MPHVKENLGDAAIIKFHTCPKTSWYKKWADLLHRQNLSKFISSTLVCSNHFEYGQPRPKSTHPSMYLEAYSVKHEIKCKEKRVVYRRIAPSDKIKGKFRRKRDNEQESTGNVESNSDPKGDGTTSQPCTPNTKTTDMSKDEEYESEILKLKMKLQEKEKENNLFQRKIK